MGAFKELDIDIQDKSRAIAILSLCVLMAGCSKFEAVGYIEQDFKPHVYKFMAIAGIEKIEVDMYYSEQDGFIIGMCRINGENKYIEIDPMWWSENSELAREQLIFHELAHCVLGQGHRNYYLHDSCPGSIMGEWHVRESCYVKHYDYYIKELMSDVD